MAVSSRLNSSRWYSGYPSLDRDFVALYGPRAPKATFDQFKLQQSKAVSQLRAWMAKNTPGAFRMVMKDAPHLLDPERNALAGLSVFGPFPGLSGLGQSMTADPNQPLDFSVIAAGADAVTSSTGATTAAGSNAPSTGGGPGDWASQLFNLASKAIPIVGQAQLLQTNISRAKSGLPPIDPSTIAPQINVGLSRGTMLAGGTGILMVGGILLALKLLGGRR